MKQSPLPEGGLIARPQERINHYDRRFNTMRKAGEDARTTRGINKWRWSTLTTEPSPEPSTEQQHQLLKDVVDNLLSDLRSGAGDRDKRRHVEEWLKAVAEKYPAFGIESGLREYYLAEAARLRGEFDNARDLTDRLNFGRSVEGFLEKAADYERRIRDKKPAS